MHYDIVVNVVANSRMFVHSDAGTNAFK